jgi:hypothetical protein
VNVPEELNTIVFGEAKAVAKSSRAPETLVGFGSAQFDGVVGV